MPEPARLDSWKEIASYFGRGIRTVQRWELQEGLPVHRLAHEKRGTVYADREELASWWKRREMTLAVKPVHKEVEATSKRFERVTTTSAATFSPALSSDARLLTYVSDCGRDGETPQVWLQQIGGAAIRLTFDQHECADPAFSADDTRIIFTAKGESARNLYEMPTLGGRPRLLQRAVKNARFSPDGKWLAYISLDPPGCLRMSAADLSNDRPFAPNLLDVACVSWSPDSGYLLVLAHLDRTIEPDYWIVPIDGRSPINTGVLRKLGLAFKPLECAPAWMGEHVIFSAATRDGVNLWRQQLTPETFQAAGNPQPVTPGADTAWFPAAALGRLAFVSARHDVNLWSVAINARNGMPYGPLRRLTRGPGILGHLSLTSDGRTLAYFTSRLGKPDLYLRDLENGSETEAPGKTGQEARGFPALSPGGTLLAYGSLVPGPRVRRPISVLDLRSGGTRQVSEDCGGRPRQWLDERYLLIETFGTGLNRFAVVDTTTGSQNDVLTGGYRSLTNPRISSNADWIAFDAAVPGGSPTVYVARAVRDELIREADWIMIDEAASHPFWSRDGRLLYYLAVAPYPDIRGIVRARHFDVASGQPHGDPVHLLTLTETLVPTLIAGTAPIVAPDQIIFVLGDFKGDIWIMDM